MPALERITNVRLPFDMRETPSGHNYGVHGLDIWFILKGDKGAVQFMANFGVYLPTVTHMQNLEWTGKIAGFDVGYHAHKPQYEGQGMHTSDCPVMGGDCYYDGSSLLAQDWAVKIFSTTGRPPEEVLWPMLEEMYQERFGIPSALLLAEGGQ